MPIVIRKTSWRPNTWLSAMQKWDRCKHFNRLQQIESFPVDYLNLGLLAKEAFKRLSIIQKSLSSNIALSPTWAPKTTNNTSTSSMQLSPWLPSSLTVPTLSFEDYQPLSPSLQLMKNKKRASPPIATCLTNQNIARSSSCKKYCFHIQPWVSIMKRSAFTQTQQ